MKTTLVVGCALALSGCAIEKVGPPGVTLTRPIRVKGRDVQVYRSAAEIPGRFSVVEPIWIKDDGETPPDVLERQLRQMAGARGANAIITDASNRRPNGTRVDLRPTLDNPFDYFSATAIWLGEGEQPQQRLGTLGVR